MSKQSGTIALSVVSGVLALLTVVAPAGACAGSETGESGAARCRRSPGFERDLAGGEHRQLRPGTPFRATRDGAPAGPHGPVPAKEVLYLGAVGAVPGGMGVVEGGVIPYKPEALKIRNENREKWLERDPEIKCYLPGVPRATYMPYPFRILQNRSAFAIAYEYAGAVRNILLKDPGRRRPILGWGSRSGNGKVRRS